MNSIINLMNNYIIYIIIAMAIIIALLFIMVIVAFRSLSRVEKRFKKMMRGMNNNNLEEVVLGYLDKVDEANKNSLEAIKLGELLERKFKKSVQKVAVIRYKAFEDVGSDLSFSIALLDDNNDGVVLTGIYGRNESTAYAKPIDKGISRYDLSEEEITALNKAINNK
ncbi:MAG: DUF4446 family protein [Clostridiaceae bacterium]